MSTKFKTLLCTSLYYVFIALWQIFIYLSNNNKYRQNILASLIYWPRPELLLQNKMFVTLFLDYFPTEREKVTLGGSYSIRKDTGTFLVGQWLGICPLPGHVFDPWSGGSHVLWGNKAHAPQPWKPMYSRVRECHSCWAPAATTEAHVPKACAPQ